MVTWYAEMLPDHPPPVAGESLTGYLTCLMERNGHGGLRALKALCYPRRGANVSHRDQTRDFPLTDWGPLSARCGVPSDQLAALTWEPLCRKFAIAPNRTGRHRFLAGFVAPTRRFCPRCLAEERRYQLAWGVQSLAGCVRHGCALLERCLACHMPIPYLSVPLRVGRCPACQQDLSTLDAPACGEEVRAASAAALRDITYLLTPAAWPLPSAIALPALGRTLMALSQERGWEMTTFAGQVGISYAQIRKCAFLGHGSWSMPLVDLWRWVRSLDLPLDAVVARASAPTDLITRLTAIIQATLDAGHRPRQAEVQRALGLSTTSWYDHPTLPTQFHGLVAAQQRAVEEHAVADAVQQLRAAGETISLGAVRRLTGMNKEHVYETPRLRQMILTARAEQEQAQEQHVADQVREALAALRTDGKPITWRQVSRRIGKSTTYVMARDRLVTLIAPWLGKRNQERAQARRREEAALLNQVQRAQQELDASDLPVTATTVAAYLGTTPSSLHRYPGVARWLHELATAKPSARTTCLQAMEQDDRHTMAVIAQRMEQRQTPVTYGIMAAHLHQQPQPHAVVRRRKHLLALWVAEQTPPAATEAHLFAQVVAAQQELQRDGVAATCLTIADYLRVPLVLLRQYPRIEAVLRQVAYAGARSHRNTPEALAREATLLAHLDEAAAELADRHLPLTRAALCRQMQCSPARLDHYPAVVTRLKAMRAAERWSRDGVGWRVGPPSPLKTDTESAHQQ